MNGYSHVGYNGTKITAAHKNLTGGVEVVVPEDMAMELVIADVAEAIAFHAIHIHPTLNGFAGYDCVTYNICRDKS